MGWFGIGSPKHVEAPRPKAPVIAPPKPAQGAKTTPLVMPDRNGAKGLNAYNQGVRAAKTQPLAPMPWSGWGGWLGAMKATFVHTAVQTAADKTQAFMDKHQKDFGPEGQKLLQKFQADGTLDKTDGEGSTLRQKLEGFLDKGGKPKEAYCLLRQIAHPDTINQVNQNTCAGATLQKALAEQNPAKYFSVMTKLADKGHAKLPGGIELTVSKDARQDILKSGMGMAERMSSYFQAAATEYANGRASYDFSTDTSKVDKKGNQDDETFKGVFLSHARDLNQALLDAKTIDPAHLKAGLQAAKDQGVGRTQAIAQFVQDRVTRDQGDGQLGTFLAVKGQHHHKAHMMLVTGVDAQGNFHVQDATGRERVWSPDKLAEKVVLEGGDKVGEDSSATAQSTTTTTTTTTTVRRR